MRIDYTDYVAHLRKEATRCRVLADQGGGQDPRIGAVTRYLDSLVTRFSADRSVPVKAV